MALLTQRQATATRAVLVGVAAVGVDIRGDLLGELGQIVGPMCGGQLGQMGFGDGTGSDVDGAGQLVQELPDHAHVARANVSGALGGGRAGSTAAATIHRSARAVGPTRRLRRRADGLPRA